MSLFTLVAPVTIAIFTIAVVRSDDMGALTGPWYLVAGLLGAFAVSTYAAYISGFTLFILTVAAVGVVVVSALYREFVDTQSETPAQLARGD